MAEWTDERRRAQAERMRNISKRPRPPMSQEQRAAKSAFMTQLNERMRTDRELKEKVIDGQKRVRGTDAARERQALHMQVTMADPKNRQTAREHAQRINRNPVVRKNQNAGRFGTGEKHGDHD